MPFLTPPQSPCEAHFSSGGAPYHFPLRGTQKPGISCTAKRQHVENDDHTLVRPGTGWVHSPCSIFPTDATTPSAGWVCVLSPDCLPPSWLNTHRPLGTLQFH